MIHLWLKNYVYNRVMVKGRKAGFRESMATMIVSAFWHGFYPFYYVMFFFCTFLNELAKEIFRSRIFFRPIPSKLKCVLAK
jgi:lysophospholipid acyltransferase